MERTEGMPYKTEKITGRTHEDLIFFESLFDQYFHPLVTYAFRFVNDWQVGEDIVQDIFMALWIKKEEIDFTRPIKPYLYRSAYNKSINYLNSFLVSKKLEPSQTLDDLLNQEILTYNQHDTLLLKEIDREIQSIIDTLPPQCQKIFTMSRKHHMSNKEIAARLSISEKAVEKQITKALGEIKKHLIRMDLMAILIGAILSSHA